MANGSLFPRRDLFRSRIARFHLARLVLSRNPFLRERYNAYAEGIGVADAAAECMARRTFTARFVLPRPDPDFLDGWREPGTRVVDGSTLDVSAEFNAYRLSDCHVLSACEGILHAPSGKVVLMPGRRIDHNLVRPFRYKSERRITKPCISLLETPRSHRHYFHFLLDFLPRVLRLLAEVPAARAGALLLRPDIIPFQQVALDHIKATYPEIEFVTVGDAEKIICDEFIVAVMTRQCMVQYFADIESIDAVRAIYRVRYGISAGPKFRKLYLSRAAQRGRRLTNESNLWKALEPMGFEMLSPEALSHQDQVRMFSEAAMVVGASGAALANLMFCQPGCTAIELRPGTFGEPLFVGLSVATGLDHHVLMGSATGARDDFPVDQDRLTALIRSLLDADDGAAR